MVGQIHSTQSSRDAEGLQDSASLVTRPDLLRERLKKDGYLYLPGFVPDALLVPLQREFLEIADDAGWLDPSAPLEHFIANPAAACGPPDPAFMNVHFEMFGRERLHQFPHARLFADFFTQLFGDQPLLHPQIRIRLRFPNFDCTTPAHQDNFVNGGALETFTVWIPLSDCPEEMGGLQLLRESPGMGLLPARSDASTGTLEITCPLPDRWMSADFHFGDALIFHSLAVHQAARNVSNRLRISIDFRFQRLSDPIDPARFLPPHTLQGWDSLYENWESGEFRYYWRQANLNCAPSLAAIREIASSADHPQSSFARELLRHL